MGDNGIALGIHLCCSLCFWQQRWSTSAYITVRYLAIALSASDVDISVQVESCWKIHTSAHCSVGIYVQCAEFILKRSMDFRTWKILNRLDCTSIVFIRHRSVFGWFYFEYPFGLSFVSVKTAGRDRLSNSQRWGLSVGIIPKLFGGADRMVGLGFGDLVI